MAGNKTRATTNIDAFRDGDFSGSDTKIASSKLKKLGGKILVNENYKQGEDKALDNVIGDILKRH
jgi:hypothetical protein